MKTRARTVLLVTAALLAALAAPRAAAAASPKEREARGHFQSGEAHFKAGQFEEALAAYQAGYDAKPLPGFLINIAQCQRRLGDLKAARATYQKFVLVAPDSPLVGQVRSLIAEIDGLLAQPEPAAPVAAAEPESADEPAPAAAAAAAPPPAPAPAATQAPILVARAGEPDTAEAPAPRRRWWLWGAIGAVVAGGVVTAIVLSSGGGATVHDGSLATLRR
jgi:tetratricopeptide (TPR) repeat protein